MQSEACCVPRDRTPGSLLVVARACRDGARGRATRASRVKRKQQLGKQTGLGLATGSLVRCLGPGRAGTGLLLWPELGARFGLRFGPDLGLDLDLDLGCKNNKDGPKKSKNWALGLKENGPNQKVKDTTSDYKN